MNTGSRVLWGDTKHQFRFLKLCLSALMLVSLVSLCFGAAGSVSAQQVGETNSSSLSNSQQVGIQYGETITGELDQGDAFIDKFNGYHENYTFSGQAGDLISVEMRPPGGPNNPEHAAQFRIYDDDGNLIEESFARGYNGYANTDYDSDSYDIPAVTLPETGTYTIVATTEDEDTYAENPAYTTEQESHTDTFAYELRLHRFVGEATSLEYNSSVNATLSAESNFNDQLNGYYDVYSFSGERNELISVEMRPPGGPNNQTHAAQFRIYDDDGNLIEESFARGYNGYADTFGSSSDIPAVALPETGKYTIVATTEDEDTYAENPAYTTEQESHTDTFAYELRLHRFVGEATSLEYNSSVNATLSAESNFNDQLNGYYDVYSFSGERNELISVEMRPPGGPNNPEHAAQFRIYDDDGNLIEESFARGYNGYADTFGSSSDIPAVALPETGKYTIVATTEDEDTDAENPAYTTEQESHTDTFAYELRLHRFVGEATSLEYNSSVNATLSAESNFNDQLNGYYDVYSFSGEENEVISVEMRPPGGPNNPEHAAQFRIYDDDGNLIEESFARGYNGYANTDYYSDSSDIPAVTLPETGTYTIVATTEEKDTDAENPAYTTEQESHTDTFAYELRLHRFVGEATSLEYNSSVNATLSAESNFNDQLNGYYDVYSFSGERNELISVEMRPPGGPNNQTHAAQFRIYDDDGNLIEESFARGYNGYADTFGFPAVALPKTGNYTIVATTEDKDTDAENPAYTTEQESHTDTFAYELRLHKFVGEETSLEYNSSVNATLSAESNFNDELNGYYDVYSFSGERNELISVEMRPPGGPNNPEHAAQFRIYDDDGNLIEESFARGYNGYANTDDDSDSYDIPAVALPETGNYTIVATTEDKDTDAENPAYTTEQESHTDTFAYELRLHKFVGEETSLEYNSSVNATLSAESNFNDELNGYYDVYSFSGERNELISVEMRPPGGPNNPEHAAQFRIYDDDGNLIEESFARGYNGYANTDDDSDSYDIPAVALPETGNYTIVATTEDEDTDAENPAYTTEQESHTDTFAYELRLHKFVGEATSLEYNSSVNATLSAESNFNDQLNGYYDVYSFSGEENEVISVEMRPPGGPNNQTHGAQFRIYDNNGDLVRESDTEGANGYADTATSSGEYYDIPAVTLPQTGNYTIVATTEDDEPPNTGSNPAYTTEQGSHADTFAYELRLHKFVGEATSLEYNSSVNATLSTESNFNDELNGYYDVYLFEAEQDTWLRMAPQDSASEQNAAQLRVYDQSGNELETGEGDLNDGTASVSGISLSPGNYTVVATSADNGGNSPYETEEDSHVATFDYGLSIVDGPTAAFSVTSEGEKTITFDAGASSLPGGEITQYEWDFDDDGDTDETGLIVTHTYDNFESYNATLTVTASEGTSDTTSQVIDIVENPLFEVSNLTASTEVTAGENIAVSYQVTNTDDVQDTQNITLAINGTTQKTETGVTLNRSETFNGQFTYDTTIGDAPAVSTTVSSVGDSASTIVRINKPANFAVTITDVDPSVITGEAVTVTYEVSNTGNMQDTQDITFTVNGTTEDTVAGVNLSESGTFSGQFIYNTTAGDAPSVLITVSSEDESATETVAVNEPSLFDVTMTSVDPAVTVGESITVAYVVTNTGDIQDTQDIGFTVNGTTEDTETEVTLNGSETFSEQFSYDTVGGDTPAVSMTVSTEDDSTAETVVVNEPPSFDVTIISVDSAVTVGESVTVVYEVTNTGGAVDTQDIGFVINGTTEDTETGVTLNQNETFSGQFTYNAVAGDTPAVSVTVLSENDSATKTVTVSEPAAFELAITGVESAVIEGETVTVEYDVTNTGDIQATQDITFAVNGTTEKTETGVTLDEDETFSGQFSYNTSNEDTSNILVTVSSEDSTGTASVTILTPARFTVGNLSAPDFAVTNSSIDVTATITNTGDVAGTQIVEFRFNGTVVTNTPVTLNGSATTTIAFNNIPLPDQNGTFEHGIFTDNDTQTAEIVLRRGPPALPGSEGPPQDVDGDARYEDVDGDGEFTIFDVQAFFVNFNGQTVRNNPAPFNFDENAGISIFDVQALFTELS